MTCLDVVEEEALIWALEYRFKNQKGDFVWMSPSDEVAYECMCAPDLELAWRRALNFTLDTGIMDDHGQIMLFEGIAAAWAHAALPTATKAQSNAWKLNFQKHANKMIALLERRPANLELSSTLFKEFFSAIVDSKHATDTVHLGMALAAPLIEDEWFDKPDCGSAMVKILARAVENISHDPVLGQGAHGRGHNVSRSLFVNELSRKLYRKTGEYKREVVALITSHLYSCNFTVKEVHRATTGLKQKASHEKSSGPRPDRIRETLDEIRDRHRADEHKRLWGDDPVPF